jgi:hypothetical protein
LTPLARLSVIVSDALIVANGLGHDVFGVVPGREARRQRVPRPCRGRGRNSAVCAATRELRITPRAGETYEDLHRRGHRDVEAWISGLEAADRPQGVKRMAELPRFIDWFWMYLSGSSIYKIEKTLPRRPDDGRRYDRKSITRGIDIVAEALGRKRVSGPERFATLKTAPRAGEWLRLPDDPASESGAPT